MLVVLKSFSDFVSTFSLHIFCVDGSLVLEVVEVAADNLDHFLDGGYVYQNSGPIDDTLDVLLCFTDYLFEVWVNLLNIVLVNQHIQIFFAILHRFRIEILVFRKLRVIQR